MQTEIKTYKDELDSSQVMLHQIFSYSDKVMLTAVWNDNPRQPNLYHPLSSFWMNKLTNKLAPY